MRTGVIKVGGASLFSPSEDFVNVRNFVNDLQRDSTNRWFVIFGGGDTVESMRTLHHHHPGLDAVRMHWRCIELLSTTTDVACELFDFKHRIDCRSSLDLAIDKKRPGAYLVNVSSYYHPDLLDSIPANLVPRESWDTTSDSLAWLLALYVRADELLLLKKPDCSSVLTVAQAAEEGIVDPQLPLLVENQPRELDVAISLIYYNHGWTRSSLK